MASLRPDAKPQRFLHLDALRVFAMAGVLVFHCGRAFDGEGWHVKNPVGAEYFSLQTTILALWLMPLFFIISGWVSHAALARSGPGRFARSRLLRLLTPFVLGTLILVPPQVYIERVTQSYVRLNFLEWFPRYFDGFYGFGGNFAWMGLHLWYLGMLLLFSLVLLPAMVALRRPAHYSFVPAWAAPILAGIALVLVELVVNRYPETWGMRSFGGWSPVTYMVFFFVGHQIGRSPQVQQVLVTWRWAWLGVAALAFAIGFGFVTGRIGALGYIGEALVRIGVSWGGIAALLGFAARHLSRPSALIEFANRYVLQVYVLHQTVIVLIVFFLLRWPVNPFEKFFVVLAGTLAVTVVGLVAYNGAKARLLPLIRPKAAHSQTTEA